MRQFETVVRWFAMALLLVGLGGCGNQDDIYPPNVEYRVTVANLTTNQIFWQVAVIIHTAGYPKAWEVGQPASEVIERLAEGGEVVPPAGSGSGKWLLTEAVKNPAVVIARIMVNSYSGAIQYIMGGGRGQLSLSVPPSQDYRLTVATNLLFTNDGFTGESDLFIGQLEVGETLTIYTKAYDAGTEANTETEMTVFGFAEYETDEFGNHIQIKGFGYDPERDYNSWGDDSDDKIALHAGVITADEPLGEDPDPDKQQIKDNSALNETHRFMQPVAKIIVERVS